EQQLVPPLWNTVWRLLKQLRTELPYDPAIPLLGIYLKETKTLNLKRHMFIVALFTTTKIKNQPKCPSIDKGIKHMWCIHSGILFSCNKEGNLVIRDNMSGPCDNEGIVLSEISQTEKDKYCIIALICGI
ncbi:LORF2 protein, partial [Crocuta crocuta]